MVVLLWPMEVESAKCPHCETLLDGEDIAELEVGDSRIAPMGLGKEAGDTLYVCPSCNTILG